MILKRDLVKRNFYSPVKWLRRIKREVYPEQGLGKVMVYSITFKVKILIYTVIFSDFMKMKLNLEL